MVVLLTPLLHGVADLPRALPCTCVRRLATYAAGPSLPLRPHTSPCRQTCPYLIPVWPCQRPQDERAQRSGRAGAAQPRSAVRRTPLVLVSAK